MSLPDSPGCKRTERVWIHLDMKGAPPTVPYLLALFPYLARWGATGLLIEWEDILPWSGSLEALKHTDAYTPDEVKTIDGVLCDCWFFGVLASFPCAYLNCHRCILFYKVQPLTGWKWCR